MISETLSEIYQLLYDAFGPQHWWPGETTFEIMAGAILTQNTSWTNVEKAIANLKSAGYLTPEALHRIDLTQLAELIRPAGYYNIKAKRLKNFVNWLFDNYSGELANLDTVYTDQLREELLAIKGIGRETADSILLYALGRPVFVVDAYTARKSRFSMSTMHCWSELAKNSARRRPGAPVAPSKNCRTRSISSIIK